MKLSKTKVVALALAVCLIAILSMGSLAWFTDNDSVTNDFHIAGSEDQNPDKVFSVDVWEDKTPEDPDGEAKLDSIEYPAILPGDNLYKEVNIENTGAYEQYVRAIVTVSDAHIWQQLHGEVYVPLNKIATDLSNKFQNWSIEYNADKDELTYVLYFNEILPAEEGKDIATLFTNIAIPKALDRDQAAAMAGGFVIKVVAEAVQTEHVGANAAEAFATVGMAIEKGNSTVATTPAGLLAVLSANVDFVLENNIDLTGYAWAPIGTEKAPYTATFDGNGYTITGLTVGTDASENAAMFAFVGEGAVIKNLKLDKVNVGGNMSATVAYYAEKATFENIEVLSGVINPAKYGAGIVHEADSITIKNCINRANVTTGFSASGIGAWILNSTVEGCENYGDITGANRAGGICANFSGTMTGCTNNGNVTGNGNMPAAGIVGVLSGAATIENCVNNGDVTATANNANASAAGILGQTPSAKVTLKSCTNNGKITSAHTAAGIGVSLYGGITAESCTNTGAISGVKGQAEIVAAKGIFGGANIIK